ncbi:MAG: GDSL-type esterase/lipase family protein [Pseudomonadota bacterium]|nr:GDSL-type esterase/lipase family protein [Pseudomonadota bacterium]
MRLSPGRKLLYASLVTAALFALVEGVAWRVEPGLVPPERTLPLPRPGQAGAFLDQAARVRDTLGGLPMVHDDATGWGLPADRIVMSGSVPCRINTLGLRGPDLAPRPPAEERILTLGDSTIFGDGVPESQVFSSVAAARLTTRWGVPVRGVIGGVPGHDSTQSLARLRDKGAGIEPTWVLVGNLWSDVYKDNGFERPSTSGAVARVKGPLAAFATYRVARTLLAPYLLRQKVGWIASMEGDVGGKDPDGRSRVLLRDYVTNLRALAAEAEKLGARPAFLALPAPVDFDPAGPPDDVREYREAMRTVAAELGGPYVDAPAWFLAHGGTIGHFADQVHPNIHGHLLIGEAVAATLGAAR